MSALLLAALLACGSPESPPAEAPVGEQPAKPDEQVPTEVDIGAFHAKHSAGEIPVLVDVRTQGEWDGGHVPGAIHIPMQEIQSRMGELESHKSAPVYVICASGGRSGRVSAQLRNDGYQAVNVLGGTKGWQAAGHPVE